MNGFAIAGGFELLYGADIRVASFDAKFGLQEVKWSVFPAGGSTVWLPSQLPYAKAMEILLTGELMDAHEAFRLGFVNKIVPANMVMEEAERLCKYHYQKRAACGIRHKEGGPCHNRHVDKRGYGKGARIRNPGFS